MKSYFHLRPTVLNDKKQFIRNGFALLKNSFDFEIDPIENPVNIFYMDQFVISQRKVGSLFSHHI